MSQDEAELKTRAFCGCYLVLAALLSLWSTNAVAQDVPRMTLQIMEEIPFPSQPVAPTVNPIRCGAGGDLYFRFYVPRLLSAPIVRFSSDGKSKTIFSTQGVKDWDGADIVDFAIGRDARVHLLTSRALIKLRKFEFGIITFDEDGKYGETIPLKLQLYSADHLAVFSTGEYLVGGYRKLQPTQEPKTAATPSDKDDQRPEVEPVTAVVDRNGTLIKEVRLPLHPPKEGEPPGEDLLSVSPGAIEGGMGTMGEDGNFYVMFRTDHPTIYVISAAGTVVRTLTIRPPSEKAIALDLTIARSVGLMVKFAEKGTGEYYSTEKTVFSLINPQTGERLYDYQANPRLGAALACYTPRGMLFLGVAKGQLGILRAEPR